MSIGVWGHIWGPQASANAEREKQKQAPICREVSLAGGQSQGTWVLLVLPWHLVLGRYAVLYLPAMGLGKLSQGSVEAAKLSSCGVGDS